MVVVSMPFILFSLAAAPHLNDDGIGDFFLANPILTFFACIAFILIYIMTVVGCYRVYLAGLIHDEETPIWRWRWRREGVFLCWEIVIGFLVFLPPLLIAMMVSDPQGAALGGGAGNSRFSGTTALFFLFSLPFALVAMRWAMIFPAIALERVGDNKLDWSWRLTAGNSWRLLLLLFVLPMLLGIVFGSAWAADSAFSAVFAASVSLLTGGFEIGLLSVCYYHLQHAADGGELPAAGAALK